MPKFSAYMKGGEGPAGAQGASIVDGILATIDDLDNKTGNAYLVGTTNPKHLFVRNPNTGLFEDQGSTASELTRVSASITTIPWSLTAIPSITTQFSTNEQKDYLNFNFTMPKGQPAGFGNVSITTKRLSYTSNPTAVITTSGPDWAKNFDFSLGIPEGVPAGFSTNQPTTVTTLDWDKDAIVKVTPNPSTPNDNKSFNFNFSIPHGRPGGFGEPTATAHFVSTYGAVTASGNIINFDGKLENEIRNLTVDIEPSQYLNGYDNPWPPGGGKNLWKPFSGTNRGITFTPQDNGTIKISGTTNGSGWISVYSDHTLEEFGLSIGDNIYVYSNKKNQNTDFIGYIRFLDSNNTKISSDLIAEGTTTIPINTAKIRLYMYGFGSSAPEAGITINKTGYFEFGKGSTIPDSWTPYSNICPITGWTNATVTVARKNLYSGKIGRDFFINNGTDSTHSTTSDILTVYPMALSGKGVYSHSNSILRKLVTILNGTYTYSWYAKANKNTTLRMGFDHGKGAQDFNVSTTWQRYSITVNFDKTTTAFIIYSTEDGITDLEIQVKDFMIEYGSSVTDYEPYSGISYPISWQSQAGTVYGGSLDVTTGLLTVDRVMITLNGSESTWAQNPLVGTNYYQYIYWADATVDNSTSSINDTFPLIRLDERAIKTGLVSYANDNGYRFSLNSNWNITTTAQWKTWLSSNNIHLVSRLKTPQTYQLTPTEIQALIGTNYLLADTGKSYITRNTFAEPRISITTDPNSPEYEKIFNFNFDIPNGIPSSFRRISATSEQIPSTSSPEVSISTSGPDYAKDIDFNFKIPQGKPAGFGNINVTTSTLPVNTDPIVNVYTTTTSLDTAKEFNFEFGIPQGYITYPYATCTTAAGTSTKIIYIKDFAFTTGTTIFVRFSNRNSVKNPMLKINDNGTPKFIYKYGSTKISTDDTTTGWSAGSVLTLTYDNTVGTVGGWIEHYWSNSTYDLANIRVGDGNFTVNNTPTNEVIEPYQLLFHKSQTTNILTALTYSSTTSTNKSMLNVEFDPFSKIYYYDSTIELTKGKEIPTSDLYLAYSNFDIRYSFNCGQTLTSKKYVYLKCTKQANGKFKILGAGNKNINPLVQDLPNNKDNFYYILLGRALNSYQISLYPENPIYYHDGYTIRELTRQSEYIDNRIIYVTQGTQKDGNKGRITINNNFITENSSLININFSKPSAVTGDISWTSTTGLLDVTFNCTEVINAYLAIGNGSYINNI